MYFIQKYTKKAIITTSDIFLFRYFVRECVQDKKKIILKHSHFVRYRKFITAWMEATQ